MDTFITYEMLLVYATCVTAVFGATQFLKDLPGLRKIPTRYLSFIVALVIIVVTNLAVKTFVAKDIMLYILSGMFISMNANGLYDFDIPTEKVETEESENE